MDFWRGVRFWGGGGGGRVGEVEVVGGAPLEGRGWGLEGEVEVVDDNLVGEGLAGGLEVMWVGDGLGGDGF